MTKAKQENSRNDFILCNIPNTYEICNVSLPKWKNWVWRMTKLNASQVNNEWQNEESRSSVEKSFVKNKTKV